MLTFWSSPEEKAVYRVLMRDFEARWECAPKFTFDESAIYSRENMANFLCTISVSL